MGTPPRCGLTNKVKLLPSRRTTYAGGKYDFTQEIYLQHRDIFEVLKIKGCTRVVVGCSYNLLLLKQILN